MIRKLASLLYIEDLETAIYRIQNAKYDDFTIGIKGANELPIFLENYLTAEQWQLVKNMLINNITARIEETKKIV